MHATVLGHPHMSIPADIAWYEIELGDEGEFWDDIAADKMEVKSIASVYSQESKWEAMMKFDLDVPPLMKGSDDQGSIQSMRVPNNKSSPDSKTNVKNLCAEDEFQLERVL
jgi:hypothetical protein